MHFANVYVQYSSNALLILRNYLVIDTSAINFQILSMLTSLVRMIRSISFRRYPLLSPYKP